MHVHSDPRFPEAFSVNKWMWRVVDEMQNCKELQSDIELWIQIRAIKRVEFELHLGQV
jgi:hypothetical protein